ncbi:MAG: DNA methyltransferase [Thaumarchaeota archaeon]|nr:DNA methyltransferase [Nitrososphaerota archaeon]
MPFILDKRLLDSRLAIIVQAFGDLSRLEAYSVLSGSLRSIRVLCDRASLLNFDTLTTEAVPKLGGIHKYACPVTFVRPNDAQGNVNEFLGKVLQHTNELSNFSLSLYCANSDASVYDDVVTSLHEGIRALGFRKSRLLRPQNQELSADDVISRRSVDFVCVPSYEGYHLGATAYVPAHDLDRRLGTEKPVPSPSISLSPRLARTLVNLASLSPGQSLLDPFCGSGTILAEGMLQSLNCIGIDRGPNRIRQTQENLSWLQGQEGSARLGAFRVEQGDARDIPRVLNGAMVDGVVTEPILLPKIHSRPTLRQAKGMVNQASEVYSKSLRSVAGVLKRGGRLVIVVPVVQALNGDEVYIILDGARELGLSEFQPRGATFDYPVRLSFESTRWVKRGVYVFVRG